VPPLGSLAPPLRGALRLAAATVGLIVAPGELLIAELALALRLRVHPQCPLALVGGGPAAARVLL